MLRSMFSGVSGLRSHQTMMDVIGNNIANVNTAGFKSSSAVFQDLLSQVITGASVPTATQGGTNPAQVGLGVRLAGTVISFTQGASQLTGRATDLSIQGDGFFMVRANGQDLYTRAGALSFDAMGRLVTPDGAMLQGWIADPAGAINTGVKPVDLTMPLGQTIAPSATANLKLGGNLDASAAVGATMTTKIKVYDEQGSPIDITFTFTKAASTPVPPAAPDHDNWTVSATATGPLGAVPVTLGGSSTFSFDQSTGALDPDPALTIALGAPAVMATPITVDLGTAGAAESLTGFTGPTDVAGLSQDGSAMGALQSFSIGADGVVTGVFSNGRNRPIGQVALATFTNPAGLISVGGSVYRDSPNSGLAQVGVPGSGGRGTLAGSTLEMSNVDLAKEFTNLIVAQRGFQANSRVITASDELLQDLVNLKR